MHMPVWYNTEQYTGTIESHCPWVCASKAPNLACERDQKRWRSAIPVGPGCFLLYRKILCHEVIDPLMVLSHTMWCVFYHHLHLRSCLGSISVQQELSHSSPLLSQKYGLWVWWSCTWAMLQTCLWSPFLVLLIQSRLCFPSHAAGKDTTINTVLRINSCS